MHGFVDVSNMSDEQIKRLGQMDDDYEPQYRPVYRKPAYKPPAFNYDANDVWAASARAYKINGGYIKVSITSESDPTLNKKSNRMIVEELLADPTKITEEDRVEGDKIRQRFNALAFNVLADRPMTEFLKTAMTLASQDKITNNLGVATIASLPATYHKMVSRDETSRRIRWAKGGFIGSEGDKVTLTIELLKQVYSSIFNTYYYTGITDKDQVLFFPNKGEFKIGTCVTIEGTVKAHRENITQFTRVKVKV